MKSGKGREKIREFWDEVNECLGMFESKEKGEEEEGEQDKEGKERTRMEVRGVG